MPDDENVALSYLAEGARKKVTVTLDHVFNGVGTNGDILLENVRVGHDTGIKSVLLVFSNFITLLFIFSAIRKAKATSDINRKACLYFVTTLMFFGMIISIFYHTCQSTGICIGASFTQWQINDHFTANLSVVSAILLAITIDDVIFYSIGGVSYIISSILLVSRDPLSVVPTIQIVGIGLILALYKHLLIDQGRITGNISRFSLKWIFFGILTAVVGSAFYIFDTGSNYFWAHSMWHLSSSLSALFILWGCTVDK